METLLPSHPLLKKAEEEPEGPPKNELQQPEGACGRAGLEQSLKQEKENVDQEMMVVVESGTKSGRSVEESAKRSKKEFAEAPPPKVNPWPKKLNAVTVVSVNGQPHNGSWLLCLPLFYLFIRLCLALFTLFWAGLNVGGLRWSPQRS